MKARPYDKDARSKYNECKKIVHQQAFAKAIAVEDKKSILEIIDLESMCKQNIFEIIRAQTLMKYFYYQRRIQNPVRYLR